MAFTEEKAGAGGMTEVVSSSLTTWEDIDIVPGTEVMTDTIHGHEQIHGDGKTQVTLVPQPSADIHDPLNWTRTWKIATISMSMMYNFMGGWVALSLNPFFITLMTYFHQGIPQIAWLTSALLLTLGFANLITVPMAVCYGRRSAYLWSMVVTLVTTLWAAGTKSYNSFLAARILMGVGTAGIETLGAVTITDVFFLHERGSLNTIYFLSLFGGSDMGGVVSGAIAGSSLGWHWFFWITAIILGVGLIAMIFLMPETAYQRVLPTSDSHENVLHRGKPSKAAFSLLPKRVNSNITPLIAIIRPFRTALAPTVLYSSFMFAFFAIMFLVVNVAQSAIFQTGYGFTVQQTGYTNFALLIGQILGMPLSGPFSDWVSMRATRKNKMVREPEMRLVALIPTISILAIGQIILGCTAAAKVHWIGPIIGIVIIGIGTTSTCVIAVTYAVDCHKPLSGEVLLVATIIKNTLSFGFAEFTNTWIAEEGFRNPFLILMGLALFLGLCPSALMYVYGKRVRRFIARKGLLPQGKGMMGE